MVKNSLNNYLKAVNYVLEVEVGGVRFSIQNFDMSEKLSIAELISLYK